MFPSKSEDHGIAALTDEYLNLYSVGISTSGAAEKRMAELNPNRQIIATTVDEKGAKFAQSYFEEHHVSNQVTVKVEDVSQPLPYANNSFDFIYARLVLHYLPKPSLIHALNELYRILKKGKKLFVVVRSTNCKEINNPSSTFDPTTCLTTYTSKRGTISRYFHTEESITKHLKEAGFTIKYTKAYEERLCYDFERKNLSSHSDALIETLAIKP